MTKMSDTSITVIYHTMSLSVLYMYTNSFPQSVILADIKDLHLCM